MSNNIISYHVMQYPNQPLAKTTPVKPPIVNNKTKPRAKL